MQNNYQQVLSELAPWFLMTVVLISVLILANSRQKKTNKQTLDNLREQSPEKWEKLTKFNAYTKLVLYFAFGLFLIGGSAYNVWLFPEGNKMPALFMACLGLGFAGWGIRSYFQDINKIRRL